MMSKPLTKSALHEQPVQFIMISAEAGLNLVSESFDPCFEVDETLVSGMLTALNTCSNEIFAKQIDQIAFGEYTMLIQSEHPFLFCYVFRGNCDYAKVSLTNLIHQLRTVDDLWSALMRTSATGVINHSILIRIHNMLIKNFLLP